MPFEKRSQYLAFIENQAVIESDWDLKFGDRKNEIVFIGQDMDQQLITSMLDACLLSEGEVESMDLKKGYEDEWPVMRAYALS